ncbi:hypothetical protein H7J50_14600 [Mycobacterium intermedium]|nr:hypothetical protein [Mycobacterium intermedium]MCV6965027.1 hypothetical protein [Mycobacterium intermedium]ODQ97985.1 hypothetical protein BHQ20_24040 [Mycobacterium intermedium]
MFPKLLSPRSIRRAATVALGSGALSAAMLFGAVPSAQAAPPSPVAGVAMAGPHGGAGIPESPAHVVPAGHGWGHGHGWGGHGGWHRGGFGHGWGHGWGHRRWWHWWW